MQFYCRLGVLTICSSVPVVILCLPVTSASSTMLFQCPLRWVTRQEFDQLMREDNAYNIFYWFRAKGEMLHILSLSLKTAESLLACVTQNKTSGTPFNNYVSGRIWILVSLRHWYLLFPPSQGEYMSQQLFRPWQMSCGELQWFGLLWVSSQLEGEGLWHPRLPGWLWLPWKRSLRGQDLRLHDRMARWAGTASPLTSLFHKLRWFE